MLNIYDIQQLTVPFFFLYRKHSLARVAKTETYLSSLPDHHRAMLSKYKQHLGVIKQCIEKNERIINHIIKDVDFMFANVHPDNADDHVRLEKIDLFKRFLLSCHCCLLWLIASVG